MTYLVNEAITEYLVKTESTTEKNAEYLKARR